MNKDLKTWLDGKATESKVITTIAKLVKGNIDAVQTNDEGRSYRSILLTGISKPVYFYFKSENNKIANRIQRIDDMNETVFVEVSIVLGVKDSNCVVADTTFTPNLNQLYLQDIKLAEKEDMEMTFD